MSPCDFTEHFKTFNLSIKNKKITHPCKATISVCPYVKQSLLSHLVRFRNTVFSLHSCGGYAGNLQHVYFFVSRQPCGFSQVYLMNAMGWLFSIGLILWFLHAYADLGIFPTALLRHMQFLWLAEQASEGVWEVQRSSFARWREGETMGALPIVRLNTGSSLYYIKTAENKMFSGLFTSFWICTWFPSDMWVDSDTKYF